jgi:hypothetical protein
MLSVIILCEMDQAPGRAAVRAEAVVRSLGALVGASVSGLVRDVVLAGPKEADLAFIADYAGCTCVEASSEADYLRLALDIVRAEDLLVLRPGYVFETGFIDEAEDLLMQGERRGGRRICAAPESYWQRLIPALAPVAGLIAPVSLYRQVGAGGKKLDFNEFIRATKSRIALRSRARRVG